MIRKIIVKVQGTICNIEVDNETLEITVPEGTHAHIISDLIRKEIQERGLWEYTVYFYLLFDNVKKIIKQCDYLRKKNIKILYLHGMVFKEMDKQEI